MWLNIRIAINIIYNVSKSKEKIMHLIEFKFYFNLNNSKIEHKKYVLKKKSQKQ